MSGHILKAGMVVIYAEWTGSEYVEHNAIVRAITGTGGGGSGHVAVNLAYSNGANAVNANNVPNIEEITTDESYWRSLGVVNPENSFPRTVTRPTQGDIVWIGSLASPEGDHFFVPGFVRSIPGNPSEPEPNINATYFDPLTEDSVNTNQVVPFNDVDAALNDHWFDFKDNEPA